MRDKTSATKEKWYWPTIVDLPGAIKASNNGVWAAGFVAAFTFVLTTISLFFSSELGGYDAWSYIDAGIFALIAWGIYRRNRFFAVAGLLVFILEKIFQLAAFGLGMLGMAIVGFFIVLFVISIKGTFAYHRVKLNSPESSS